MKHKIKVIAFDADDTLWVNESYYRNTEDAFAELLRDYGDREFVIDKLFKMEMQNLELYGYGAKGFMLSMMETAIELSSGKLPADIQTKIIGLGKKLINSPLVLLPEAEEVLAKLKLKYKLILATKGDLLDQERKLRNSKLMPYFHHVEIMSDKKIENYQKLLDHLEIEPDELLMIGNSMRSDVLPPLELGCYTAHIPYHTTWLHEDISDQKIDSERFYDLIKLSDILDELL